MSRPAKSRGEKGRAFSASVPPPLPSPAKPVDIIAGRLSKSHWLAMVEQEEGEEVVVEILHELMQRVMEKCYELYLERQLVPFVVSGAQDTLVQLVGCLFPGKDEGEGLDSTPHWVEDTEPQPCSTDSWAQGCVPVVHAKVPPHALEQVTDTEGPLPQDDTKEHVSYKKRRDSMEPQGSLSIQSVALMPTPPLKKEQKKTKLPPRRVVPKVPVSLPRLLGSPSSSVSPKEEPLPRNQHGRAKTLPKPSDSRVPRLDPGHYRKQIVWPVFEVLEANILQQSPQKVSPRSRPKQEKRYTRRLVSQGPSALSCSPQASHRRSSLDGGLRPLSSDTGWKEQGHPQPWVPPTSMLQLDSMELSPGVVLRDPLDVHSSSYRRFHEPDHRQNLKPIRSSVPTPLLSVHQIVSGRPSCIPSLSLSQDNE